MRVASLSAQLDSNNWKPAMKLTSFRVSKFRNIVDSGEIAADPSVTCFVGKNEAGKSGLLDALYLFNPAYGEKFSVDDHYPRWLVVRDRKAGELKTHSPITVVFELEASDLAAVTDVLGDGVIIGNALTISKQYDGETIWEIELSEKAVLRHLSFELPEGEQQAFTDQSSLDQFKVLLKSRSEGEQPLTAEMLAAVNAEIASAGLNTADVFTRVVQLLTPHLPKFFRFNQYSTLPGRIDFRELANSKAEGPGSSGLQTARSLLSLAGSDTKQLGNDNYELRKSELEAVQIDLTNQVFEYWKQNEYLEVLIDVDKDTVQQPNGQTAVARFLDIRLRDKRTGYSNNFSQRSSGFQWFFSFLAAFSEFESHASPIVLLDEPALTLHAKAQADFLRFINERLAPSAPVLYTTHSPFMIEADKLHRVRIVEDNGPPLGATCSSDVLASDQSSLFPLQAALGYDIAQNLFVGSNNLVVEGTSDYIFLTTMSQVCIGSGRVGLDEKWRILPAGGATNIPTFVSLVGPHLDVTVLADSDTQGMQRVTNMVSQKLLSGHRLIMASVASPSKDADLEDLFSDGDYLRLYNATFGTVIKEADLPLGSRVVKRIESREGKFIHGKVAEMLLKDRQAQTFSDESLDRFATLFAAINKTIGT